MEKKALRILVAEDDFIISQDIRKILEGIGHQVVAEAATGREAVDLTVEHGPDLVFMDIRMPEMDGLAAADLIQEKRPTPVIVLTAYDDDELALRAARSGASAFLVKPAREREIRRVIVIALARHGDLMECRRLNQELAQALREIKILRGILPICSFCKNIRNATGY